MNVVVKRSGVQGKGVYASKNFRKSEMILVIDDSHEVKNLSDLTPKQHDYDCDYLSNGRVILMQSPEKYINHSCDPNSFVRTIKGVRKVFAMRGIKKGEEITYDYTINSYNDGSFKCNCGSKNCRIRYQGNFFKLPKEIKLKYLPYLESWFVKEHKKEVERLFKS